MCLLQKGPLFKYKIYLIPNRVSVTLSVTPTAFQVPAHVNHMTVVLGGSHTGVQMARKISVACE